MATEAANKVGVVEKKPEAAEPPLAAVMGKPNDAVEEKPVAPAGDHDSKALAVTQKAPEASANQNTKGSLDRDIALAKLEDEKKLAFIKAWEESEKTKVENNAQKKFSEVTAWENSKKATLEAKIRQIEEQLEKKKADYAEKMRNKIALIHKQAEEKRAMVEAKQGEDILKASEMAAKYRATGHVPKKVLGCFGG